jgi:hypothetical protein
MLRLYLHPLLQVGLMALSFYVLYLGLSRAQTLHLGRPRPFAWGRHVRLGLVVMVGWFAAGLAGAVTARLTWHAWGLTGGHLKSALVATPFLLFGLGSGLVLHYCKKKRKVLPVAHGLNNLFLVGLALGHLVTGRQALVSLIL